jgi:hypothetical protein
MKGFRVGRACGTHGKKENAYKVFVRKSEEKGRCTRGREHSIKMGKCCLAENRDRWQRIVNTDMSL